MKGRGRLEWRRDIPGRKKKKKTGKVLGREKNGTVGKK